MFTCKMLTFVKCLLMYLQCLLVYLKNVSFVKSLLLKCLLLWNVHSCTCEIFTCEMLTFVNAYLCTCKLLNCEMFTFVKVSIWYRNFTMAKKKHVTSTQVNISQVHKQTFHKSKHFKSKHSQVDILQAKHTQMKMQTHIGFTTKLSLHASHQKELWRSVVGNVCREVLWWSFAEVCRREVLERSWRSVREKLENIIVEKSWRGVFFFSGFVFFVVVFGCVSILHLGCVSVFVL